MKKLFTTICMIAFMACHVYGDNKMALASKAGMIKKKLEMEQRVKRLVRLAREGEAEAYKMLAQCYLNGDGVEKSMLNMLYLYCAYQEIAGLQNDSTLKIPEEMDMLGVRMAYKNGDLSEDEIDILSGMMKEINPTEAKAIETVKLMRKDSLEYLAKLREAEGEGSELAVFWQVIHYEETEDSTNLIQTVNRLEKKHPFLNLYLGKLYVNNYSTTYDVNDLLKGIRYIYKADMSGMMTPEYAKLLLHIYTTFDSIKPVDEEAEIGRLKKFIKQN